jgi:hypothetical protein
MVNFFGQTHKTLHFDGLTITDTEYTHPFVDWHYHENPYFTFLLQGNMTEEIRKKFYDCSAEHCCIIIGKMRITT